VSLVRIDRHWSPKVRYAARKYRRDMKKALRNFEKRIRQGATEGQATQVQCAEEAQAIINLLKRLGYGADKPRGSTTQRLELELQVHELDKEASINFFRLFLAQRKGMPLDRVFSRKGRVETLEKAEKIRAKHIEELKRTVEARKAVKGWLDLHYGPMEARKKYREFARLHFDPSIDGQTRLSYLSLLITQMAERSGRDREELLEEYKALAEGLLSPEPEMEEGEDEGEGEEAQE
jgi:hypothetical protein